MKEFLLFLPLTVVYLVFKSTVFENIPVPDLSLVIIFYLAYRKASVEGVLLGFTLGYIEDAFTGGIIGSTSFSLVFVFTAAYLLAKKVQFSTPIMRAGGVAAAGLVKGLLMLVILRSVNSQAPFLTHVISQAVVTGVTSPAIIIFLSRITAWVNPQTFKDSEN